MMTEINKILKEILNDINIIIEDVFKDNEISENIKVGKNTLWNSDLQKQAETKMGSSTDPVINILFNDYISYVERGREAKHEPRVPIEPLIEWAQKKNIHMGNKTLRQVAFMAQRSIYEKGIRPRPILHYVFENIDKQWDKEWTDKLFNEIIKDINKFFN